MTNQATTLNKPPAGLADQEICREALLEKYAKGEECSAPDAIRQVRLRVARAPRVRFVKGRADPADRHEEGTAASVSGIETA